MDTQIIFIIILSVISVTLGAVSAYLILVLKELRKTIERANTILEDVENVTNAVANPLSIISNAVQGYKSIKNLFKEN